MSDSPITRVTNHIVTAYQTLQSETESAAVNWGDPKSAELFQSIREIQQNGDRVMTCGDNANRSLEAFIRISEERY